MSSRKVRRIVAVARFRCRTSVKAKMLGLNRGMPVARSTSKGR